ncbi:MAG TPA: glutamate formimidoyltransferase [Candidatus Limnocylindrales bacterium]|jgi:glutamate formiminotransferase
MKVLMAVPNVCEGRDPAVIDRIVDAVRRTDGVKLIDVSSDVNHNRTVITYLGAVEPVREASQRMSLVALDLIDMRVHHGAHPRVGAVDAVPFVPVHDMEMREAVEVAHAFGRFLGEQGVPVWYYGAAASAPGGPVGSSKLTQQLLGEYENLARQVVDEAWPPDEGPRTFDPRHGACTVAARSHLICFNVNLSTTDLSIAKRIAKVIRQSSGGYRDVQAMGVELKSRGLVQVSMMTTRDVDTPLPRLLETVRFEAARHGVAVVGTEFSGPIPLRALEEVVRHYLQLHEFSVQQIIENALI